MSPTTLITFRLRAARGTRSVQLYGSWDDFTTPYSMSKDLQIGSEYWSGCFNFSNIICDGRPSDIITPRNGSLKMGGTYWYYYKLDDTTDFHNVCERATTNCPLLPGQLVNILHVPYAFSGSRSRDPSTSSIRCEPRTMNPEDRFMNPRPAPAKPEQIRVSTSPTLISSEDDDPATVKEGQSTSRFLRLPRKGSIDSSGDISPGGAIAGGLRAAFRARTTRSQSPEAKHDTDLLAHRRAASVERNTRPRHNLIRGERSKRPACDLLLRSTSEESVRTLSFEDHRRQRSYSRETSRSKSSNGADTMHLSDLKLIKSNKMQLGTVKEVSPVEEPAGNELDLGKRLPTLPNTPSSAYPASILNQSPERKGGFAIEELNSHFSATTIDTDVNPLSMVFDEQSHFSAWTSTTAASSIFVDSSEPLPELRHELMPVRNKLDEPSYHDAYLPSTMSYGSMSSSMSTTPSTSFFDTDAEFDAAEQMNKFGPANSATTHVQHYSLPEDEVGSQATLKAPYDDTARGRTGNPPAVHVNHSHKLDYGSDGIVHSESMQRLLDELSYLSEIIQR